MQQGAQAAFLRATQQLLQATQQFLQATQQKGEPIRPEMEIACSGVTKYIIKSLPEPWKLHAGVIKYNKNRLRRLMSTSRSLRQTLGARFGFLSACCPCSPRLCSRRPRPCRSRLPSAEQALRATLARVLASTAACRPNPCSRRLPRPARARLVCALAALARAGIGCRLPWAQRLPSCWPPACTVVSMERGSDVIIRRLS